MKQILSWLTSEINNVLVGAGVICAFFLGAYGSHLYYSAVIARSQAAEAKAVAAQKAEHEKAIAEAANTILLANDQYSVIKSERDALVKRLRELNANSLRQAGSSPDALRRRAAACDKVAAGLLEAAQRCGDGWQRCAAKHDGLTKIAQ